MKQSITRWALFIIIGLSLVSTAASPTSLSTAKEYSFELTSTYGDKDKFSFSVAEGGCIIAQVKDWSRSGTSGSTASQLALILNGSDRTSYYARIDGGYTSITPLWTSYSVPSSQVSKVNTWTISVVNFTKSGTAKGTLSLEYPPTQTPCELKVAVSRTSGQIDLGWVYTGRSFRGSFLIEHSTDGRNWSVISACTKTAPTALGTTSINYSCSDTRLTSGRTYYYRACAVSSGTVCDTRKYITPPKSVKVP